jgi:hypothetical protein
MTVRELLRRLLLPCAILCAFFAAATFMSPVLAGRPGLPDWVRRKTDLRIEGNYATWFEGLLMLLCAASFVPLAFARRRTGGASRSLRYLFALFAIGFVFLAADELLTIHEGLGARICGTLPPASQSRVARAGFLWLLVYGPVAVVALALLAYALAKLVAAMPPGAAWKRRSWLMLGVCLFALPAVLLMEGLEACAAAEHAGHAVRWVLGAAEEAMELLAVLALTGCNTGIAIEHHF